MKKLLTFLFIILFSVPLFSQTRVYILTETIRNCRINTETLSVFNCDTETKMAGVFIIDDMISEQWGEETILHITPFADSEYYIQRFHTDSSIALADVVSDTGNKYRLLFEWEDDRVSAIFMNDNEPNTSRRLTTFTIANILIIE